MSHLQAILEAKRQEIEVSRARMPMRELERRLGSAGPVRGFLRALTAAQDIGLIAEIKASSPSQGSIRKNLNPVAIARAYEKAGAHALSVLTDRRFFGGSAEDLVAARDSTGLPVLRKDFILTPYQVYESRAMGADAILLIAAALPDPELRRLSELARCQHMDVIVEVHDEAELDRALALGFDLIGVNNRNLATFETDLGVSERLLPKISANALGVSESAIETRADVDRVKAAGARAVLIGTTFCSANNVGAKVREVMAWP